MGSYRHPWIGCKRFKSVHYDNSDTSATFDATLQIIFNIVRAILWFTTILPIAFWSADQVLPCHIVQHAMLAYYTFLYCRPMRGTYLSIHYAIRAHMCALSLGSQIRLILHTHQQKLWPWMNKTWNTWTCDTRTLFIIKSNSITRCLSLVVRHQGMNKCDFVHTGECTMQSQAAGPCGQLDKAYHIPDWTPAIIPGSIARCLPLIVRHRGLNLRVPEDNHKVIIDSGATYHYMGIPFKGQNENEPKLEIMHAGGETIQSQAAGPCGQLDRAYYVPAIQTSLLGVGELCKQMKIGILFTESGAHTVPNHVDIMNLPTTTTVADIDNENMYIMRPGTFGLPSTTPPVIKHQIAMKTTIHACNACGHKATLKLEDEMILYDSSPYGRPCISDIPVAHTGQLALLELFCGYGVLSRRVSKAGLPVGPPGDLLFGDDFSLDSTIAKYRRIIEVQRPVLLWVAFPCTPWSTWQKVNQQYHKDPTYLERWRDKYREIIRKVTQLCILQTHLGGKVAVEGPLRSAMWSDPVYMDLAYGCDLRNSQIDQCMLGAVCPDTGKPFKKPTKIHHNFPVEMNTLKGHMCRHAAYEHDHLTGYAKCGLPKTKLAGRYPAMMCDMLTEALIYLCQKFRPSLLPSGGAPPLAHHAWLVQAHKASIKQKPSTWTVVPQSKPLGFKRQKSTSIINELATDVAWLNIAVSNVHRNPARIFHEASGHISWDAMRAMIKHNLIAKRKNGKPLFTNKDILRAEKGDCHGCRMGKPVRLPFKGHVFTDPFTQPLETFVAHDTYGEVHAKGMHGERWFILFVTRRSRWCYVYFMKNKSEVPDCVRRFLADYQRDFNGAKPTVIHCDNDAVNIEETLVQELKAKCIRVQTVTPHCEESNPAERYIRKITTIARCLLAQSGLPIGLWPFAVQTAVYLHNRTPSRANRVKPIETVGDANDSDTVVPVTDYRINDLVSYWLCGRKGAPQKGHIVGSSTTKDNDIIYRVQLQSKGLAPIVIAKPGNLEHYDCGESKTIHIASTPKHGKSPFELERGHPPDMSNILPWGSRVYVTLHQDGRVTQRKVISGSKLAPAATSAWFIGYNNVVGGSLSYRVYVPGAANAKNGKVYDRRHITFWKGHNPDLLGDQLWRQQALRSPLNDPQMEMPNHDPKEHPGCAKTGKRITPGPLELLNDFSDIVKTVDPVTKKMNNPAAVPEKKRVTFETINNRRQILLDNEQKCAIERASKVDPSLLQASKYPTDPNEHPYIGMYIMKQFDSDKGESHLHTGIVTSTDVCDDTALRLWHINYADSDEEDLDDVELRHQIKLTVHARKKLKAISANTPAKVNCTSVNNSSIFARVCHLAAHYTPIQAVKALRWTIQEPILPYIQPPRSYNLTSKLSGQSQPELQKQHSYLFNTLLYDGLAAQSNQWEIVSEGIWGLPVEITRANLAHATHHCFMYNAPASQLDVPTVPTVLDHLNSTAEILADSVDVPRNVKAAISPSNKYRGKWVAAILKELTQLQMRQTYEIVKRKSLPRGRRPITGKMVLAVKRHPNGTIAKFKARYVAHGFRQSEGFDYYKTFAPVVATTTVRMILAHAMYHNHDLYQLDIAGAFLLSDVDADIWMDPSSLIRDLMNKGKQPHECITAAEVLRLKKGLYGLKQSAMLWHKDFDKAMKSLGFTCTQNADLCAYTRVTPDGAGRIIVAVHVDDCVISCTKGYNLAAKFRDEISKKFDLSSYGELDYLLGVRCETVNGAVDKYLSTNQTGDIESLMRRFHSDVLPSKRAPTTPLSKSDRFTKEQCPTTDEQKQAMLKTPFRPLIGSLLFLARNRVDIAASVGILSSFNSNPGPIHFKAGRRILSYLYGTRKLGFCYGANKHHWTAQKYSNCISASVDADFAGALVCGKSRTGYVIRMYGDTVEALTQLQRATTNSTGHAELKALAHLVRKLTFYRDILPLFGLEFDPKHPFQVESDSSAAIALLRREYIKFSMTHMRTDFYQILEAIQESLINLGHVPGLSNVADILTKVLPPKEHHRHTPRIMNQPRNVDIARTVGANISVISRERTTVHTPKQIALLNRVTAIDAILTHRDNLSVYATKLAKVQHEANQIRSRNSGSQWKANLMHLIGSHSAASDNKRMLELQKLDTQFRSVGHAESAQLAIKEQQYHPFPQLFGTPTWMVDAYETPTQCMRSVPVHKCIEQIRKGGKQAKNWANHCAHSHPIQPASNEIVWFCTSCRYQSCDACSQKPHFACNCTVYPHATVHKSI